MIEKDWYEYEEIEKDGRTAFGYFNIIINNAGALHNHFHIRVNIIGELLYLHHIFVDMVCELLSCPDIPVYLLEDLRDLSVDMPCKFLSRLHIGNNMVCGLEGSRHRHQILLLCQHI